MTLDQIQALAREIEWPEEHISFLADSIKPSIDISITSQNPQPASSRFGGDPYVPHGFTWPVHKVGRYRFLGQFNFEQLSRCQQRFKTDTVFVVPAI